MRYTVKSEDFALNGEPVKKGATVTIPNGAAARRAVAAGDLEPAKEPKESAARGAAPAAAKGAKAGGKKRAAKSPSRAQILADVTAANETAGATAGTRTTRTQVQAG
jgi:hypothetical protein